MSQIVKRSVNIAGHMTSVSLEQEFWEALKGIAQSQARPVADLIAEIDKTRSGGLSSAIRVYVLKASKTLTRNNYLGLVSSFKMPRNTSTGLGASC